MEYILGVLLALISGLGFVIFRQDKKIKRLDNDVKTKEFEVEANKKKEQLKIKQAIIKGAELGATKAVENFRSKYKHLIKSDDEPGAE